jgi:S1-C subfamily serine protease
VTRLLALPALALALAGCGSNGNDAKGDGAPAVTQTTTTRVEVVEGIDGGFDPRTIYEREAPGVVTVIALFGEGGLASLLRGDEDRGDTGLGSGFVIDGKGEIATNAHVVTTGEGRSAKRASELYVEFADGNRVEAKIVGDDPNADIALLKIDPKGLDLNPLPLGSSGDVKVGNPVAAMGSPFGERQSLSVGVVSAIGRDIDSLTDFKISGAVQTDAAINPGNSGGPLVDAKGRVIGVNQQIKTASGGGEGVGFAVPIDLVKRSLDQLREDGKAEYAYVGVASQGVYPQLADKFNLPVKRGAWLQEVTDDGPAQKAGLRGGAAREVEFQASTVRVGGDIVTKIAGDVIEDSNDLSEAVSKYRPGDEVAFEYYRGKDKRTAKVKLGVRPLVVARPRSRP